MKLVINPLWNPNEKPGWMVHWISVASLLCLPPSRSWSWGSAGPWGCWGHCCLGRGASRAPGAGWGTVGCRPGCQAYPQGLWTGTASPASSGPAGCGTWWGSPGESAPGGGRERWSERGREERERHKWESESSNVVMMGWWSLVMLQLCCALKKRALISHWILSY